MRTSLPVSTISYNTVDFLKQALGDMVANGEISFWAFVPHIGEGGDKNHIHVYCEPTKLRTQDDWKKQYFLEFDPEKPDKPRSVTTWRKSVWKDWYLYGLHNKLYLMSKGEAKQYEYEVTDFVTSDDDTFAQYIADCDVPVGDSTFLAVRACVEAGMTWAEAACSGLIPTRNLTSARELYALLEASYAVPPVEHTEDGYTITSDPVEVASADGLFGGLHERILG